MASVQLDTKLITDWASFHFVCKEAFGFPEFYGMNMDAWIDCLWYLAGDGEMTRFVLAENEMLHIEITDTDNFNSRLPEVFDALIECSAFVNKRYIERKDKPRISLVFLQELLEKCFSMWNDFGWQKHIVLHLNSERSFYRNVSSFRTNNTCF